ncbi:hypothetical protein FRB99_006360 [Tulasnella sp. 403]|nr:hypothetical protein FRB99_006360 [Tulasnella sp. 403]
MPAPKESYGIRVTDIYPGIAPEKFRGLHAGKVVFITGGATGLGLAAAKAFSQSGAKVFIAARRVSKLEAAKAEIEAAGGEADFAVVDVIDPASVKAGIDAAVKRFGRLDIVIANAGGHPDTDKKITESDPDDWWSCMESSLKGTYLTAHAALPELVKTGNGYFIVLSSALAQVRIPGGSSYNIAKLSLTRFADWVDIEYRGQGVKAFAVHPGAVATDLSDSLANTTFAGIPVFTHSPNLSAWSYVRLTSGSEDWLSGRFVDLTWNLDEISTLKEKILEQDALKARLALPVE